MLRLGPLFRETSRQARSNPLLLPLPLMPPSSGLCSTIILLCREPTPYSRHQSSAAGHLSLDYSNFCLPSSAPPLNCAQAVTTIKRPSCRRWVSAEPWDLACL